MTAMSGSFTALAENPAGAGLYRQAAFGSDLSFYSTTHFKNSNNFPTGNALSMNVANLGYISKEPESGVNIFLPTTQTIYFVKTYVTIRLVGAASSSNG